jgi:hypothetical protein
VTFPDESSGEKIPLEKYLCCLLIFYSVFVISLWFAKTVILETRDKSFTTYVHKDDGGESLKKRGMVW